MKRKRKKRVVLTETQKKELLARGYNGESWRDLAKTYGVHVSTVACFRAKYPRATATPLNDRDERVAKKRKKRERKESRAEVEHQSPKLRRDTSRAEVEHQSPKLRRDTSREHQSPKLRRDTSRAEAERAVRWNRIDDHLLVIFKLDTPLEKVFAGVAAAIYNTTQD